PAPVSVWAKRHSPEYRAVHRTCSVLLRATAIRKDESGYFYGWVVFGVAPQAVRGLHPIGYHASRRAATSDTRSSPWRSEIVGAFTRAPPPTRGRRRPSRRRRPRRSSARV